MRRNPRWDNCFPRSHSRCFQWSVLWMVPWPRRRERAKVFLHNRSDLLPENSQTRGGWGGNLKHKIVLVRQTWKASDRNVVSGRQEGESLISQSIPYSCLASWSARVPWLPGCLPDFPTACLWLPVCYPACLLSCLFICLLVPCVVGSAGL